MKTINAKIETELVISDDGLHTYEIIKRLVGVEGECGYLISLYPTRNKDNIFSNDSTMNHIVSHMDELGFNELHIINLFSKVTQGKMSVRGLQVDNENMQYIDRIMADKKFQDSKLVIAWGNSMLTSQAVIDSKNEIFTMFKKYCPKNKLYQLSPIERQVDSSVAPHPLYLGIRAADATWGLQEFKLTDKMIQKKPKPEMIIIQSGDSKKKKQ